MKRMEMVADYVRQETRRMVEEQSLDESRLDARAIAAHLQYERSNISRDLNALWKEGRLVKTQTHPVVFYDTNTLLRAYSLSHIPNTIYKNEKITDYLTEKQPAQKAERTDDELDRFIGAQGSLASQVSLAKAAVSYPDDGLPVLLTGEHGTGKWRLANSMLAYAVSHQRKPPSARLLRIDCSNFQTISPAFSEYLFGAAKGYDAKSAEHATKGAIDECAHGILYLDNIENLDPSNFEILSDVLSKRSYSRLGDNALRPLNCMIIGVSTNPRGEKMSTIRSRFPIQIDLPGFNDRNLYEKIEITLSGFAEEARRIHMPIRFHKDILSCFLNHSYKENENDLRNEIQQTIARSYFDKLGSSLGVLSINFQHLSLEMMEGNYSSPAQARVSRALSLIDHDYILIDESGNSDTIDFFHNISDRFGMTRLSQFVSEFSVDIESLDTVYTYINESIECLSNCGNAQLAAVKNSINPDIYRIVTNNLVTSRAQEVFRENPNLLYGLLLHLTNLIRRKKEQPGQKDEAEFASSYTENYYRDELEDALRISGAIKSQLQVALSKKEIDFMALYFASACQFFSTNLPSVLLLSHGEHVASDILEFVKPLVPASIRIAAVDYPRSMQLNDLLEYVLIKVHEIDSGAGILIISDYDPLLSISDHLRESENIRSRTIAPLSIPLVLDSLEKISSRMSLDQIAQGVKKQEPKAEGALPSPVIQKFIRDYLGPSLTFLNPSKAAEALLASLKGITQDMRIPMDNQIMIKFLYHCTNMLERTINKTPLDFPDLPHYMKRHRRLFRIMEKNLVNCEEIFGVKIPNSEIAYVVDMFVLMGNPRPAPAA